jgi:hypothetical protein
MKKLVLLFAITVLSLACVAQPTEADEKWLAAVQKMVTSGKTEVTTPSQDRVDLLKTWAGKNGYTIEVTKTTGGGFKLGVTRQVAGK